MRISFCRTCCRSQECALSQCVWLNKGNADTSQISWHGKRLFLPSLLNICLSPKPFSAACCIIGSNSPWQPNGCWFFFSFSQTPRPRLESLTVVWLTGEDDHSAERPLWPINTSTHCSSAIKKKSDFYRGLLNAPKNMKNTQAVQEHTQKYMFSVPCYMLHVPCWVPWTGTPKQTKVWRIFFNEQLFSDYYN